MITDAARPHALRSSAIALGVSYTRTDSAGDASAALLAGHILGTDDLGRDHLARLLYAGQVSLSVGFIAAILSLSIGVSLGIITGYYGGIVDDFINWVIATLNSIPSLFLLIDRRGSTSALAGDTDHRARLPRLDDDNPPGSRRNALYP